MQPNDEELNEYINANDYVRNLSTLLPDGTEIFIGVTVKLQAGEWVQKSTFAKVQNMDKAKRTRIKIPVKQKEAMAEHKEVAEDMKNMRLTENEF